MDWNDPAIWSVVISFIAIILSQLPPVRDLFRGTKINIKIPETFQLYHHLGNTNISIFIDIHNIGGRNVIIDKIQCIFVDVDHRYQILPAHSYVSRDALDLNGNSLEYPISRIILRPEERWHETMRCFKFWSESDEELVNQLMLDMRNDIESQPRIENKLIEAKTDIVNRVTNFFNSHFFLHKGNYHLLIVAFSEDNIPLEIKGYEFTLFENHLRALVSHVDDYKYGFGILFPQRDPMKFLTIRLRNSSDQKYAKKLYNNILKKQ